MVPPFALSRRLAVLLLALVAGLWAYAPTDATAATRYGVHMDLTFNGWAHERQAAITRARDDLGVQVSRNSLLWDKVEKRPGERDWTVTDAVVAELEAAGIEPLFVIYGSPEWASGVAPGTDNSRAYVPTGDAEFTAWLAAYTDFVREAARRYKGRVRLWELGNEQNERNFWKPSPDPRRYARFYTALHGAIRAEQPQAQTAMGGLAGIAAGGDIPGIEFLKQVHELGVYPERIALHPYPSKSHAPDVHVKWHDNFDDIQLVRDYLESIGRPVPIWVTEWGWSSAVVGPHKQAQYTAKSLAMIRDRYRYVEIATMFVDYDRPTYTQGLFDSSGNAKPAAEVFASHARSAAFVGPVVPPSLAAAKARPGAGRLVVHAKPIDCTPCEVKLELKGAGQRRTVKMTPAGPRVKADVRLRPGRWRYRFVARHRSTGAITRSKYRTVRVR